MSEEVEAGQGHGEDGGDDEGDEEDRVRDNIIRRDQAEPCTFYTH